ncbi:MAG: aminopeptidase P N-terminal domain-containing protein [Leptospirillia bacterium]
MTSRDSMSVFARRRERLMEAMQGGVAIFPAAPERVRSNDTHHPFRQDSDFFYLTGFTEPGAYLVLRPDHPKQRVTLYVRPRNPDMERWNGRRAGVRGAKNRHGADAAFETERFISDLPSLLKGCETLYLRLGGDSALDESVIGQIAALRARSRSGEHAPARVVDPAPLLAEFRLLKSDEEVAMLEKAAALTAAGHLAAMRRVKPGMYEYQAQAEVEYQFRYGGSAGPAYGTICGSGVNATILHYVENDRRMKKGDLLLIDAGAEYLGYAGDVTRTIPVGGVYSDSQRAVYKVVLAAQKAAIRKVKPGATFDQVHQAAVKKLTEGLIHLGLLKGKPAARIKDGSYRRFYMHRTSHWLGLDVHDAGRYQEDGGGSIRLMPGMVLTVEPGLYIDKDADLPAEYRGIGIRIEDDVLVTDDGCRVLTEAIPKEPAAIERVMAGG